VVKEKSSKKKKEKKKRPLRVYDTNNQKKTCGANRGVGVGSRKPKTENLDQPGNIARNFVDGSFEKQTEVRIKLTPRVCENRKKEKLKEADRKQKTKRAYAPGIKDSQRKCGGTTVLFLQWVRTSPGQLPGS